MAQFSDFISRIFNNDRTQGLSGGGQSVVAPDAASAFYAARLQKHKTDADLVAEPDHLWSTSANGGRGVGLRAHITGERGDGIARFTDVLIVINQADARRAAALTGTPWTERAAAALDGHFQHYCAKDRYALRYATRPLRYWILADGGSDMLHQTYGLEAGEFLTGLVPNLYVGPGPHSQPAIAVHLNVPGAWQGYREVGRLYNDQMLFTLGRHWLDNFHHPGLCEPGLYRLQQYPDGSLVHMINPELQHRYTVRSDTVEGGANVLTIQTTAGEAVAYLVLAVVDPAAADASAPRPTRTIVPEALESRILTLQERGALLQRVHFSKYMLGYDVHIGSGGIVATQMADPRASLQVREDSVSLIAHGPGVRAGGAVVAPGGSRGLSGTVVIDIDGHSLTYRDLSGVQVEGWPYLGELSRSGAGSYLDFGAIHRIGRDRRCAVCLPDEAQNDNITWLPSVGTGSTIRARTGEIPKSRFYTDSIMVASEHAELDLTAEPRVRSLARQCYTFVRRGEHVQSLVPRWDGAQGEMEQALQPGDELLIGNCLFQVSFQPNRGAAPAPAPTPTVLPAGSPAPFDVRGRTLELPAAAGLGESGAPPRAPDLGASPHGITMELPVAAGLGESGAAPRPVQFGIAGGAVTPRGLTMDVPAAAGLGESGSAPRPVSTPRAAAPMLLDAAALAEPPRWIAPEPRAVPSTPLLSFDDAYRPEVTPAPLPPAADNPGGDADAKGVVSVSEAGWQREIARPGRLLQAGWLVTGDVVIGNHTGCAVVIPENRASDDQGFLPNDYVALRVDGDSGRVELLQAADARVIADGRPVGVIERVEGVRIEILRRDLNLRPDFDIALTVQDAPGLPDPRASLLVPDLSDRMVAALFTIGLSVDSVRRVRIGDLEASARFDGHTLTLSDYAASYRLPDGPLRPGFVRTGARPFLPLPDDGAPIALAAGDTLIIGNRLFRFETA